MLTAIAFLQYTLNTDVLLSIILLLLHCAFRWQLKYYEEQLKSFAEVDRYCKIRLQRLSDTLKAKDEGVFHDAVEDLEDLPEELLQDSDDGVEDEKKEVTTNIRHLKQRLITINRKRAQVRDKQVSVVVMPSILVWLFSYTILETFNSRWSLASLDLDFDLGSVCVL